MKIEKLEPSRHKKGRVLLFLDDGTLLKVTEEELLRFSLHRGDELTEETLVSLRASASVSSAKAEAAALLGRRPMSRADLVKKLKEKGASAAEAAYAAEWLEAVGVLDDAAYAAMLARHYSAMGYGKLRLAEELRRHGIDKELWEDAFAEAPAPEETARAFLAARFKGNAPDEKELKRAQDALLRRGFSWGEVRDALEPYKKERFD